MVWLSAAANTRKARNVRSTTPTKYVPPSESPRDRVGRSGGGGHSISSGSVCASSSSLFVSVLSVHSAPSRRKSCLVDLAGGACGLEAQHAAGPAGRAVLLLAVSSTKRCRSSRVIQVAAGTSGSGCSNSTSQYSRPVAGSGWAAHTYVGAMPCCVAQRSSSVTTTPCSGSPCHTVLKPAAIPCCGWRVAGGGWRVAILPAWWGG